MIGWSPIETAPMDGTRVMVFCLGEARIARWNGYSWLTVPGDYTLRKDYPPTHWMPLPDPPSTKTPDEVIAEIISNGPYR